MDQHELLMFCRFANPRVREEIVRSSFDGLPDRLDYSQFEKWAKQNKPIINPEVCATPVSPPGRRVASGPAVGSSVTGAGSISKICMNLPCMTIDDNVLTPVK